MRSKQNETCVKALSIWGCFPWDLPVLQLLSSYPGAHSGSHKPQTITPKRIRGRLSQPPKKTGGTARTSWNDTATYGWDCQRLPKCQIKVGEFCSHFFRISQVKNGPLCILLKNIEKTCFNGIWKACKTKTIKNRRYDNSTAKQKTPNQTKTTKL